MTKPSNIFISWSGKRSLWVAEGLREWLPIILQSAVPWLSAKDIDKGSRGLFEVTKALNGMKVGIVCLTPENQTEPWILYEAGALSKAIDEKSRLCTYLLGGLKNQDVKPPLGMFQHTKADAEETFLLLQTINNAINEEPLQDQTLRRLFDKFWPEFRHKIETMPVPEQEVEASRPLEEMMAEVLELTRTAADRRKKSDFLEQYVPLFADLLPFFAQFRNSVVHGQGLGGIAPLPPPPPPERRTFLIRIQGDPEPKRVVGTGIWRTKHGGVDVFDGASTIASFGRNAEVVSDTKFDPADRSVEDK